MKYMLLFFFLFSSGISMAQGQAKSPSENVVITSKKGKTHVQTNENGELHLNVSPKDVRKFKTKGLVRYSDFGARGDGKTDDTDAIAAAHAFANQHSLSVKADDGATYYIGGKNRTAVIRTDTDFGTAAFIIDDTNVQNRNAHVFLVSSGLQSFKLEGVSALKRNQEKIGVTLPGTCIVTVTNSNVRRYIRFGANQNNGSAQTDIFIVDKNGNVDMDAPIVWDFDQITDITALPIDETTLTITGGRFTTIANKAESKYTYYSRGIAIRRSNVIVDGLEHRVTSEGDHGAPYGGFINVGDCSYVTVRNTILTGRKMYQTIGAAGVTVSMGSYDLSVNRALNVSFVNCSQTNDINDSKYWGILGSNFCKNLVYDNCTFSRFDAHMGVANATIRNSTLGHMGINAIGSGTFTVENCTIHGRTLINLRSDYGSTWQGEFIIRNCVFVPAGGRPTSASLIGGSYSGQHDFGYTCYMPERITIENLKIDDSNHPEDYKGPAIFANFNPKMTDESYVEKFPYVKTREVILRDVTTASGKTLRLSDNLFMFKDVKIITD
ncbi:MAG: right-handed parallel beta-helix repeat-containing protein [Bacteroidota bacterium]|nr:right-handed parallel beta-helix repeat-containing protein [Bacteroidota bacterium]